jgi:hypothetical protein
VQLPNVDLQQRCYYYFQIRIKRFRHDFLHRSKFDNQSYHRVYRECLTEVEIVLVILHLEALVQDLLSATLAKLLEIGEDIREDVIVGVHSVNVARLSPAESADVDDALDDGV